MNGDGQTATFNCEISNMWPMKPRTTPQKTSPVLMGPARGTRPKTFKLYDDDDDDDDDNNNNNNNNVTNCTAHNTHHSLKHFLPTLLNI